MANQSLNGVLQHLRKVAAVQTYQSLSDRELLHRFVEAHEEAAFTVLIERHGPMVLGVCRRSLPNFHDAEDACQATFLVLARKACSVRKKTSISSWLHGVACRVAISLKRDHIRRKNRERSVSEAALKDPAAEVSWREVQTILDEELQQLPERYRAPLILCYLECMARDEAAQHLGLTTASLRGRLERARDVLRRQLSKRGVTLAAAMSAAALGPSLAKAAPSPTLVVSLTKAATLLAAGQPLSESVVAAKVITLTQEILKSMFLSKLKLGTAAILCAGLLMAMVAGTFTSQGVAQDPTPKPSVTYYQPGQPPVTYYQPAVTTYEILKRGSQDPESDADFIRRMSKDLRGIEPTPTEIHFFVNSKDPDRRQKLIDLFIQERQAKKAANDKAAWKRSIYYSKPKDAVPYRYLEKYEVAPIEKPSLEKPKVEERQYYWEYESLQYDKFRSRPIEKPRTEAPSTSTQKTSRIQLINHYPDEVTFYINDKAYVVPMNSAILLDELVPGNFSYQIVAPRFGEVASNANAVLEAGKTYMLTAR